MKTQQTAVARTASERDDLLHELANGQDGVAKALRHISHLADSAHPLVRDIWRNLTRAQSYITQAQEDVRVEPFQADQPEDEAA